MSSVSHNPCPFQVVVYDNLVSLHLGWKGLTIVWIECVDITSHGMFYIFSRSFDSPLEVVVNFDDHHGGPLWRSGSVSDFSIKRSVVRVPQVAGFAVVPFGQWYLKPQCPFIHHSSSHRRDITLSVESDVKPQTFTFTFSLISRRPMD